MRVYGFFVDSNKIVYAFAEVYGEKIKRIIMNQGGKSYIRTGTAMERNLERHFFSDTQEAALNAFIDSPQIIKVYDIGL